MWIWWVMGCAQPWTVADYAKGRAEVFCERQLECYATEPAEDCVQSGTDQWLDQSNYYILEEDCTFMAINAESCVETLWDSACDDIVSEPDICEEVFDCPS